MKSKHDTYFQKSLAHKNISIPLLMKELPGSITCHMDFEKMEPVESTYITERLDYKVSDVVFKVPYKGEGSFILILVEHQSTPDRLMTFRLFLYILLLVEKLHREYEEEREAKAREGITLPIRKLPTVFPMIFYNGELQFKNMTLADCFEDPEMFTQIISNKPLVVNAADDKPSQLDNSWYLLFRRLMGFIYDRQLHRILLDLERDMLQIDKEGERGTQFLVDCLHYLVSSARHYNETGVQQLVEKLEQSRGEFMTVLEQMEQRIAKNYEGRIVEVEQQLREKEQLAREKEQLARQKEKELELQQKKMVSKKETATSMLQRGFAQKDIAELLKMSLNEVATLADNL